jgi:hypothetical protein
MSFNACFTGTEYFGLGAGVATLLTRWESRVIPNRKIIQELLPSRVVVQETDFSEFSNLKQKMSKKRFVEAILLQSVPKMGERGI